MKNLRDEVYWWCLNLIDQGYKLEAIFLILSTWNFAWFSKVLTKFDVEEFEKVLNQCDFDFFKGKRFEELDLTDNIITSKIAHIYSSLSQLNGIKYVGATKIMHILNPKVFVLWDNAIIKKYKVSTTADGYLKFFIKMQDKYNHNEFGELDTQQVTIPRAIDLYNLI